ncbi:hypothetical protein U0070_014160 [Myodes glareolus]|uniref:Uncharacterized protein n=1 Tax=Myodes glareolus TaxID=447135 RepID=A0AAW0GZF3_MYOGA
MITRQPETPLTNLAQPQLCLRVVLGVAPTSGLHLAFSRWLESSRLLSHRISGEPQLSPAISRLPPSYRVVHGHFWKD